MLAIKIWNYLKGYVIIRIEGLALERLLNLALTNNIYLWDVKGFPFLLKKIIERKMFFIGFLLFFLITFLLSSFSWKIEINGALKTPKENIMLFLGENGILSGTHKSKLTEDETKLLLINEYDYFSFVDVRIMGVNLIIDIEEEDIPPDKIDKSYPANIVSRKKGVITKVIPRNGESIVEEGQVVRENQVLISGVLENNELGYYLVHADGEVFVNTSYEAEPVLKKMEKETDRVFKQRGLKINKQGIRLIKDIPFDNYKEYITKENIVDLGFIDLPIKLISYEYREIQLKEVKQNIESIKNANQLKAIEIINKQLFEGVEIISRDVIHTRDGNILRTQVVVETIEDIGKKVFINN